MTSSLGQAAQLASVWLVATVVTALLSAVLYPAFRRAVHRSDPSTRSMATLGYALIAPATGLVTAVVSMYPEVARVLVPAHCHADACDSHAPLLAGGSLGGVGLTAAASLLAFIAVAGALRVVVYGRRRLRSLFALSRRAREREHLIVDSNDLFAWCCGLFRQRIVLSRGLIERLSDAELRVVLAHERTHLARFDNLRNLAARWATIIWPRGPRARIRADLVADGERVCDLAALSAAGSPGLFRRVVEAISPRSDAMPRPGGVTFGCADPVSRFAAVADEGRGRHPLFAASLVAVLWILQVAAAIFLSHPVVETIAAFGG